MTVWALYVGSSWEEMRLSGLYATQASAITAARAHMRSDKLPGGGRWVKDVSKPNDTYITWRRADDVVWVRPQEVHP